MIFKLSRYLFFIGLFALMSVTAFAEGFDCRGRIMGTTTLIDGNEGNEGRIYFNSHGEPAGGASIEDLRAGFYGIEVDVDILDGVDPGTKSLAPADVEDAACAGEAIGTLTYDSGLVNGVSFDYEYKLEGYAWNDNLGFINFLGHETAPSSNYAVVVGPEVGGYRDLAGYAWSGSGAGPAFGYIQFKGEGYDPIKGNFSYGVTMNASTGELSGEAWTDAGMYIDFEGVYLELPGEEIEVPESEDCKAGEYSGLCVDVSIGDDPGYWYDIDLYLEDPSSTISSLTFVWTDTIKLNQLAGSGKEVDFNKDERPVENDGGILSKPIKVDSSNFDEWFVEVGDVKGHYQLVEKIKSLAPTSGSNVSDTTSTTPAFSVSNEFFANELSVDGYGVWTDEIYPNELILENIAYVIDSGGDKIMGVADPDRRDRFIFEFSPEIEMNTLFARTNDDTIVGFRNVPINFTMQAESNGYLEDTNAEVYVVLDYDRSLTTDECEAGTSTGFEYYFLDEGGFTENTTAIEVGYEKGGDWSFSSIVNSDNVTAILLTSPFIEQVYNAVAALPEVEVPEGQEPPLPCDVVQGPTLYTVVKYTVNPSKELVVETGSTSKSTTSTPKTVYYYSNKIPRILSAAYNPAAIIHGNVYAPKAFSPTASHETQETGYLAVNVVRNTINENISKFLGEINLNDGEDCTITALEGGSAEISGCDNSYYSTFEVGDESVLYFKGSDVTLNMGDPAHLADSDFLGNWVIIVQDARVFIDSDLYHKNPADGNLVLISMSTYDGSCDVNNIYLHADVKNIDANIVADCSLFPYHPDVAMPSVDDGIPEWTYDEKIEKLNKQKLFRGSIASRNTIGGADLDVLAGKEYLLLGTGEVVDLSDIDSDDLLDARLDAQNYDFNYMAFFILEVELASNGLPYDQRCQRALTIADMIAINDDPYGHGITGEVDGVTVPCDGIDLVQYDPVETGTGNGDLVVLDENRMNLARGLDNESDFNPIYIYAASSGSFVFEKSGEVTSWN